MNKTLISHSKSYDIASSIDFSGYTLFISLKIITTQVFFMEPSESQAVEGLRSITPSMFYEVMAYNHLPSALSSTLKIVLMLLGKPTFSKQDTNYYI